VKYIHEAVSYQLPFVF